MRVCPSCQSRFVGGETFCPHDGTKLVDARELSPGELTGSRLDDIVRLDKLAYSDAFAERYTGRLLESRRAVYVTVFNQTFQVDPSATKRVETARAKVGSPMPPQINTLLQTHFDRQVPFLVESEPRGPSVRTLLDEKRTLDWQHAVRITANLARAMQWLHEQGVPHCSFHPTSVFVTNLQHGEVVVGDWALEALFPPDSAERLVEEDPNSFAGYIDYMAPEIARSTERADIRSAVYALGCVLYEMVLGRVPLPGKSPAEVLKRHRHEKPVRLSIAVEGQELPEQLDDIVEMMLTKDPDKRFQSPAAAVAALSNLVNEAPDALAPQLERADETDVDDLYRTINMESVDREELEAASEPDTDSKPTLMMGSGQPAVAANLVTGGAVSGESATADDGDATNERSTGQYNKPAAVAPDDTTNESIDIDAATRPTTPIAESSKKKTLALGSLKGLMDKKEDGDGVDDVDDANKKTLISFGGASEEPVAADSKPSDETVKVDVDSTTLDADADATTKPDHEAPAPSPAASSDGGEAASFSNKETIKLDPSEASSVGLTTGEPTGAIRPDASRDATRDIDASDWFSPDTEDVWENSLAQEAEEYSEQSNRKIVLGIVGALILGTLGLIAYFEFVATPADGETDEPVASQTSGEEEEPEINLAEIKTAFDDALDAGRVIEPIGNSALTHLESLKRHGPDDPSYEEARARFVQTARDAAKKADERGDLRAARALAGYASQFAPDDDELKKMTADLQARFTGAVAEQADMGTAADMASSDAGADGGLDTGPDTEETPEEPAEVAERPEKKPPKKRRPRKKTPKKKTADAGALIREASVAHKSGNLDQARKLYKRALDAAPTNAIALAGLGKVYFDKADYRSAVKYQTKAVRYAPGRNDYRINLGQSYYRLGKYSEAIAVWEKVLARDPANSTARQYVELAKRKLGR